MRPARVVAVGAAVLLVALVAVLATRPAAESRVAASPVVGHAAPEISGRGLDGKPVRLSSMRGQFVVINFFATWCVPCQREHPELIKFSQRHQARGDAQILSIIFDDDVASVRRFFEEKGGNWPVLDDSGGKVALELGVRGPPESFLIDPEGVIRAKIIGEVDADELDDLIERASR